VVTRARGPVEVHIDELVVDGWEGADGRRLAEAVRIELHRLLAEGGGPFVPAVVVDRTEVDAGSVPAPPGASPEAVGARVAAAVHAGLEWRA
jgi:hypothetical protein